MRLETYVEPSAALEVGNSRIILRPLSVADIATLRACHGQHFFDTILTYANEFRSGCRQRRHRSMIAAALDLTDLIADLIALSAREPEFAKTAKRLPLGIQIAALIQISQLSRTDLMFPSPEQGFRELLELALVGSDVAEVVH